MEAKTNSVFGLGGFLVDEEEKPTVYIVSDFTGETAEFVVKAVASQFNSGGVEIRRIPFVDSAQKLREIIQQRAGERSMIVYTLVFPEFRRIAEEETRRLDIPSVDIMGPMMEAFSRIIPRDPRMEPGLLRRLDEDYFRRMAAIEFAVKNDDGKDPYSLDMADVVLVGVSRTSKTPLSMYLAHRLMKVANFPLVPESPPPQELFQLSPRRVIGLTIQPQILKEIRVERLNTLGVQQRGNYASMKRILEELEYADKYMRRLRCPVFDVSNKAVEEVANKILQVVKEEETIES